MPHKKGSPRRVLRDIDGYITNAHEFTWGDSYLEGVRLSLQQHLVIRLPAAGIDRAAEQDENREGDIIVDITSTVNSEPVWRH